MGNNINNLIQIGEELFQKADLDAAEQKYREALSGDPSCVEALFGLAKVFDARGDFDNSALYNKRALEIAEQKYREALSGDPSCVEALFGLAKVFDARGDFDNSALYASHALRINPDYKPAHTLLGLAFYELKKYEEALKELTIGDEDNVYIHGYMGLCYEKLDKFEEAEKHIRIALEHDRTYLTRYSKMAIYDYNPFFAELHHALARVLQRQGKNKEAHLHYHLTKRIAPTTKLDKMYLEIISKEDLDKHPFIDYPELEKPPADSKPEEKLTYLLKLSDYTKLREAISDYKTEDLISFAADMIYVAQLKGNFYFSAQVREIGDLLTGRDAANLFEALKTSSWRRLLELAEMLHNDTLSEKEALDLATEIEFNQETSSLLINLGERFVELDPETGLTLAQLIEKVLKKGDRISYAESLKLLGKAYLRVKRLEKAAEAFQKVLDIYQEINEPEGTLQATYDLGHIWLLQKKYSEALNIFDRYICLAEALEQPEIAVIGKYSHALTLFEAGRAAESYDECLLLYHLVQETPVEITVLKNLNKLLAEAAAVAKRSVPDEVLERFQSKSISQEPVTSDSLDSLLTKAALDRDKGNLKEAVVNLKKACEKAESGYSRKTQFSVLTELADVLMETELYSETKDVLIKALEISKPISVEVDIWPVLIDLATLEELEDQKDKVAEYLESALKVALQQKSEEREAKTYQLLSNIFRDTNPELAVEYFDRFLELSETSFEQLPGDWTEGMNAMLASRFREGIAFLERLVFDKSPEAISRLPEVFANLGIAHIHLHEIPEAISCWEKAAEIWLERSQTYEAIEILNRLVLLQKQEHKDPKATLERMQVVWESIEIPGLKRRTGIKLADGVVEAGGDLALAAKILNEVISIATSEEWQDLGDELEGRKQLGRVYRQMSRYREALEEYYSALACAQEIKDEIAEGEIRGWMGIAYRYLDELDTAVEQYRQAIKISERYQNTEAAEVHRMHLASSLFLLDRIREATDTAIEAFNYFDRAGYKDQALKLLCMLNSYVELEALPQELQLRITGLVEEGTESGDPIVKGWSLTKKAWIKAAEGDVKSSWDIMEKVIIMDSNSGDHYNEASAFLNRARMLADGNTMLAVSDATRALEIAESIGQVRLTVECEELLLELEVDNELQVKYYLNKLLAEWIRLRQRLRHDIDRVKFVDKATKVLENCIIYFLRKGQKSWAFELQEWKRAQSLNDLVVNSDLICKRSEEPEVKALLEKESEILTKIHSLEITSLEDTVEKREVKGTKASVSDMEIELDKVYTELEKFDPYYVLQKRGRPLDITRARNLLSAFDRPAIIVTLGFVDDEVVSMSLRTDQEKPESHHMGITRDQVNEILESFKEENEYGEEAVVVTWPEKAAILLKGVVNEVRKNDLVVLVAEEDLQNLPLQALEFSNGQSLVEYAAVVYTPNLTLFETLYHCVPVSKKIDPEFLSIGVAFSDEARAISISFSGIGNCLSGNNVPKAELRKALYGKDIVHFACHGYFDSENYQESGLILSTRDTHLRENILSVRDLLTWHLDSSLAVLSACETGRGKASPSEFLGLGRGFLAAGARSVIVALWKINSEATQAFMLTFYENLRKQLEERENIDLAECLRQTQCYYAKTSDLLYLWAGFKLIGWPIITLKGGK